MWRDGDRMFEGESYDCIVIGAGHAGVEAALACARMGQRTLIVTLSLDSIGLMPCNPAIGGTGKGHLVRELDAMGGEMGLAADDTLIQMRMLNTGKGPAVHSLRAQMDKRRYHERIKRSLEAQPNLTLLQDEVVGILAAHGRVSGVETAQGFHFPARAVVLASGVYLQSRILIGDYSRLSGPCGLGRAESLSDSLRALGLPLQRFKTGTPARVKRESLDLERMEPQYGDEPSPVFSFLHEKRSIKQDCCYLTYTNADTHRLILDNLSRSPMYSGKIHATGTRYCPSIEDKLVRYPDKERHQLFIEPEGRSTSEMYVQGMSTSLPADVQLAMLRTIEGLRHCEVLRLGYAIEYDCLEPTALDNALMVKTLPGLFTAGQVNGTSGYEEAAAQGLYAGVNAALYLKGEPPLLLSRQDAYLGVLVDDLTVKGTNEPYRMMTSRCEYRLLLRQDNADERLTRLCLRTGLIGEERLRRLTEKEQAVSKALSKLDAHVPPTEALRAFLSARGEALPPQGTTLYDLLKRPFVRYDELNALFEGLDALSDEAKEQVELKAHYDGYIQKQGERIARERALEDALLPADADYAKLDGLRLEARQKLNALRPRSIGQAGRISGVTPADVSVLMIYLKRGFPAGEEQA